MATFLLTRDDAKPYTYCVWPLTARPEMRRGRYRAEVPPVMRCGFDVWHALIRDVSLAAMQGLILSPGGGPYRIDIAIARREGTNDAE